MDELIAFVKARLDEDEAAARGLCGDGPYIAEWLISGEFIFVGTDPLPEEPIVHARDERVAQWIARHDPARVLRDVEADRQLLFKYEIGKKLLPGPYKLGYCEALEEVIKIRAARFSGHPDYRDEWKP
jgi:hypothetical protein